MTTKYLLHEGKKEEKKWNISGPRYLLAYRMRILNSAKISLETEKPLRLSGTEAHSSRC